MRKITILFVINAIHYSQSNIDLRESCYSRFMFFFQTYAKSILFCELHPTSYLRRQDFFRYDLLSTAYADVRFCFFQLIHKIFTRILRV